MSKRNPTAEQRLYHNRLREWGCVIRKQPGATIHHVHGGSMRGLISRGGAMKTDHWLVIPLHISLHSMGQYAIDGGYGVESWERRFGTQLYWLAFAADAMKVDVFTLAGIDRPAHIPKYPEDA